MEINKNSHCENENKFIMNKKHEYVALLSVQIIYFC